MKGLRKALLKVLYFPLALILAAGPWRFVTITHPGRIGHLAADIDWFLKKQALGHFPGVRPVVLLAGRKSFANAALVDIWARYVSIIRSPALRVLMGPLTSFKWLKISTAAATVEDPADYPILSGTWGDRPPFLRLSDDLIAAGEANLRAMGLPAGAWFVCVHARDNLYSPNDAAHNDSRNCDIGNYELAVDAILARGGWCLRMGEPGTKPLKARPGVVNYQDSAWRSDWMDLFLCSRARFFLGNTSGIYVVAAVAGVPCALANMIPHGACYGFGARDLSIVKYFHDAAGKAMRFDDIFASDLSTRSHSFMRAEGLSVVENSAEEIRDLAVEMLDILDGRAEYTGEDEELQAKFRSLLDARHYTCGAPGRIGRDFLRQNAHLFAGARRAPAIASEVR